MVTTEGIELTLPAGVTLPRAGLGALLWRFCRKKPLGAVGGLLMVVMVVTAVLATVLATHDPIRTDANRTLARPAGDHWLGTDHLGRDIYSRIVHGAQVSLVVGLASTLLGSVLGGIIGLLSGYLGGKTDLITQRVMDILQGMPLLVLALVMSAALGPSIPNVIIAISVPIIPRAARVIRSSVLSIREMQYIEAARGLGVGHLRIAFRQIGRPSQCSSSLWRMLAVSASEYAQKAPHLVLFPGFAISLAVFGSNLLGDALRDTLDPRLRGA
ncbi:MAG: ABC transporter permease [Candidatus Rokubacteria bacterium]|nr:ABC transporter permease [Candidatus Rokubacteria bacterium]